MVTKQILIQFHQPVGPVPDVLKLESWVFDVPANTHGMLDATDTHIAAELYDCTGRLCTRVHCVTAPAARVAQDRLAGEGHGHVRSRV
jgi:hypothetical protein